MAEPVEVGDHYGASDRLGFGECSRQLGPPFKRIRALARLGVG